MSWNPNAKVQERKSNTDITIQPLSTTEHCTLVNVM